jgi:hypothetical protein
VDGGNAFAILIFARAEPSLGLCSLLPLDSQDLSLRVFAGLFELRNNVENFNQENLHNRKLPRDEVSFKV